MGHSPVTFTVFTKPWKMSLEELAERVAHLGFDGVELPVRPGFQVEPDDVARGLPRAARILGQSGVAIASVAGPVDEPTIGACAEAGVPLIRICQRMDDEEGYLAAEEKVRRRYDRLVPLLDRHGVTLGIQNHCGLQVPNALGLRRILDRYSPRHVAAVWDPAHCALDGERPELAIDILWSHLRLVNLKNAFWRRTTGPEADVVAWTHYWTLGRQGLCHWPTVAGLLRQRGYQGPVCLTAEYSDQEAVDRLVVEDFAFARSLFA
ncbi:MAG: sugar phosphate isomerase/epimerase family protein [Candidatus Brocadiia bacterium]